MAWHGIAALLVYALMLVFWRYRRSADIPLTLTAGNLLYLLTDLLDTVNAAYHLPAPLSNALSTGALTLPAALITIAGIVQWTARSQTALRRQRRLNRRLTALNEMMRTLNVSADTAAVARSVLAGHARAAAGAARCCSPTRPRANLNSSPPPARRASNSSACACRRAPAWPVGPRARDGRCAWPTRRSTAASTPGSTA
jgi:hypothetical protein